MTTEVLKNNQNDDYFASRVKTLGKADLVALRRAFGDARTKASGEALAAFYKICPHNVKDEEAPFLAACAIAYILHYGNGKNSFVQCLKEVNISESRIKALLSNNYVDKDGFFHSKYSRLVRYVVSQGYLPNIDEIYSALTDWWKYRIAFTKEYYNDYNNTNNN